MDSLSLDKLPRFKDKLADELQEIKDDFQLGKLATEWSIFRLCRLVVENKFVGQEIVNERDGGKIIFTNDHKQFISYACDLLNVSRATVYNKLDVYRNLLSQRGLGEDYAGAFRLTISSPGVVGKLAEIISFGNDGSIEKVDASKAAVFKKFADDPDKYLEDLHKATTDEERADLVRPCAKKFVQEAAVMDNRKKASEMANETLARSTVKYRHNGHTNLVQKCTERCVDMQTGEIFEREFMVEWQPIGDIPDWVLRDLYSRTGALEAKE